MYLIAIGWLYVALMMAVVEAFSTQGTVIGGVFTFLGYGLMPVALVVYILSSGDRRRARQKAELADGTVSDGQPDASGHAPAAAQPSGVAPVGKEP
jgi:mannose/fructose/N-acetylgalactosamine-specific phosphotransferase system component IID